MLAVVTSTWPLLILAAVIGYLLGSVNWAIIVTRLFSNKDIREEGSGNAGATNVLRAHGKRAAALTAVGDVAKSMLAAFLGGWLPLFLLSVIPVWEAALPGDFSAEYLRFMGGYIGGFFSIIGHVFPAFYGFRGGKGVLTTLGMFLVVDWRVALICLGIFIIIVACCRLVSLGSVLAIGFGPILVPVFGILVDHSTPPAVVYGTAFACLVEMVIVLKHKENLKRIAAGTERRLGEKAEGSK